jgi:secreted trypsin-like serine protease
MQVDLTVQHRDNCLIQYIDNDQFCAGNVYKRKDTCNGDSGGPLLKLVNNRWTLVGVVSNGDVSCSGTGIYINVPFFYDWITSNTVS